METNSLSFVAKDMLMEKNENMLENASYLKEIEF
jgi:hypothetical protein